MADGRYLDDDQPRTAGAGTVGMVGMVPDVRVCGSSLIENQPREPSGQLRLD